MSSDLGYTLINHVLGAAGELLRESHRFFRPLGLTEVQFNVLNVLAHAEEGMSQRELSDILVVDRSNITTLLDRMEKAGWVKRTDHPTDRRVYCVTLTAAGRKLHSRTHPLYLQAIENIVADIPDAQIKQAFVVLQKLQVGLRRWSSERPMIEERP